MNWKAIAIPLMAAVGLAQPQAAPVFEVASIKPSAGGSGFGIHPSPGGRWDVSNMTLENLIAFAYEVKESEISGAPKWLASDAYDIVGKAQGDVSSPGKMKALFQSLLADRFKLAVHYETKEGAVFALVVAKGGIKMQPTAEGSCTPVDFNHVPAPVPGQPRPRYCGALQSRPGEAGSSVLNAIGVGMTKPPGGMMGLTDVLSRAAGRTVVDKTGLTGIYDFQLAWTQENAAAPPPDGAPPSIFTALQEQLGLKLEPDKGPVRVLVIDHVEKPTPN